MAGLLAAHLVFAQRPAVVQVEGMVVVAQSASGLTRTLLAILARREMLTSRRFFGPGLLKLGLTRDSFRAEFVSPSFHSETRFAAVLGCYA